MAQRIYRITELRSTQDVPGRARAATEADRELLVAWVGAFAAESMPEGAPDRGAERTVDARLRAGSAASRSGRRRPSLARRLGGETPNGLASALCTPLLNTGVGGTEAR